MRLQARVEAISRADNAALENARRVAGPVLAEVASGQAPSPALRQVAAQCGALISDLGDHELLIRLEPAR